MLRDLSFLMQLQEVDLRIQEQELAKKQLPATVIELQQAVLEAQKALDTTQSLLQDAENELVKLEDQIAQAQTGLSKSQERLNSIKTNREYDAVHAEIEGQKSIIHNSDVHKQKITEEIDRQRSSVDSAKLELDRIKGENDPKIAELSTTIASIDSVIAEIRKERDAITPQINKSILRTYDLIWNRRRHGRVISMVSPQARTCSVCYKVLEPQIISEIRRATKLILCQNCGSIFIWTEKTP